MTSGIITVWPGAALLQTKSVSTEMWNKCLQSSFCCCSGRFQEYSEKITKGLQRHVVRWAPRFTEADLVSADCGSNVVPLRLWDRLQLWDAHSSKGSLQTSTFSSGCDFILTCNLSPGPDSAFRIPLVVHTQHVELPYIGAFVHVLFIIISDIYLNVYIKRIV